MKFRYIDYAASLFRYIDKNPENIYIFSDYLMKNGQLRFLESEKSIFEPDPLFLTFSEFKELIFDTDRVILSEVKRFIDFYNSMKIELEEINIFSYFDSIEFADKFFKYYTEKNRAICKKNIDLEEWQKQFFDSFDRIKNKYQKHLDEKGYIPKDWIENIENLNFENIKKYKKIIFIDVIDFSKLDKFLVFELKKYFEIEFILQMESETFDEENLELKEVKLPEIQKGNFKFLVVKNELEIAGNILKFSKEANVFSPEAKENRFYKLLPNNYMKSSFAVLNNTRFFKFIEAQANLLSTIDLKNKMVPLDTFLKEIYTLEMKDYYDLDENDYFEIYELMDFGYKYIERFKNKKFEKIYEDLLSLYNKKSVNEYIDYFKKLLKIEYFKEKKYVDFYEKLQEYLGYAKTTELMFKDVENSCLKNGGDILRFILQYFNNVEIKFIEDTEGKILIKEIESCRTILSKKSIFINTSSKFLPKNSGDSILLTEKQKKENGFKTTEKARKEEKYRFYQAILKNKENIFIYVEDKDENEVITSLLSEVKNKYSYEVLESEVSKDDILKNILNYTSEDIPVYQKKKLEKKDQTGVMKIGFYKYSELSECEFKFFLKNVLKIKELKIENSKEIALKVLGSFIHEVYEKVADRMWKKVLNSNNFSLDREEVNRIFESIFIKNREKIPKYLEEYFKIILIPRFKNKLFEFYEILEERYKNKRLKRLESEKNRDNEKPILEGKVNVFLEGRVDLVVETDSEKHIIDLKTGKIKEEQLDFYSIMLYGDETQAKKSNYHVFDGKLDDSNKIRLTKEELKETIFQYFVTKEYRKSEKKSVCLNCEMKDICKREF